MAPKSSKSAKFNDTMRPEYDMSNAIRGKYVKRFTQDLMMVTLEPDVAFPDTDSVNRALRVLMKAAKKVVPAV